MHPVIKKAIQASPEHAISYRTFIQLALYDETYGYYMREQEKIGRQGDFFTSSNISSIYAQQFASFFIKLVEGGWVPPIVCEIGGGTGRFAFDVLTEWKKESPDTFSSLQYIIIETSPYHRKLQLQKLHPFSNVKQLTSIEQISSFSGIVFSNELFDAFPVEVIENTEHGLVEVLVTLNEQDELVEKQVPLQNKAILQYLHSHNLHLKDGQRFEIPLQMSEFVHQLANCIEQGICISVDYGYTNEEWMHPLHREGSLRGYYKHQLIRNPLLHPGEMDITSHIHWDELEKAGEEVGLKTVLRVKQTRFLLSTGIMQKLINHNDNNPFSEKNKQNRAIRSLILQGSMSDYFHVSIQQKGVSSFSLGDLLDTSMLMT